MFKLPAPLFIHPLLFESNCVYRLVIYIIHLISGKVINVTGLENYDIATGVRNIKFIPVVFHVLFPHYSSYYNVIKYTYVRIHLHIHVTSFSSLCYFFFLPLLFSFSPSSLSHFRSLFLSVHVTRKSHYCRRCVSWVFHIGMRDTKLLVIKLLKLIFRV